MGSVAINPPKTPVTKGSNGIAAATLPNVCKMPGPPAPFVPTPLPNIGRSGNSPKEYSTTVKIEGNPVAIKGASFSSQGDVASKGTGGGMVSANTHGPTKFVGPGSMDVKIEGKNVQLLGDPMLNNCGASGSPANSATLTGVMQLPLGSGPNERLYPEQTCNNTTREDLHAKKDEVCNKIPGGSMSPKKVSPKKLDKIPCSVIKSRIAAQTQCLKARETMRDQCFNAPIDENDPDQVVRKKDHDQAIQDVKNGLAHSKALEAVNCAPGHKMAGL
ncbi:PAAR-like domain-containing protein [Sorangium sp. So ce388]|uniref:PAAR-like domain-containing protein n=1 Tax=Sorangium sp. So ce388 TaxID=3133309 RepID=UPI003F5C8538